MSYDCFLLQIEFLTFLFFDFKKKGENDQIETCVLFSYQQDIIMDISLSF